MTLYHASTVIIQRPDVIHSRERLDFGKGFMLPSSGSKPKNMRSVFYAKGKKPISTSMKYVVTYPVSTRKNLRLMMKNGWIM